MTPRARINIAARTILAIAVLASLTIALTSRPAKRLIDFDQSFYLTIAYDLAHHRIFSNGVFDDVDSTRAAPPPGMFFGPLFPALIVAAMKADARFAQAVTCATEANEKKRTLETCEVYARPIHVIHAVLLTLAVLAIAFSAEIIFSSRAVFFIAAIAGSAGLAAEAELLSYIMTESLTFALYSFAALSLVLGWKRSRGYYFALAGLFLGLLCLTRPSFVVLVPVILLLIVVQARWLSAGGKIWGRALGFSAAVLIVIAPWVARNALALGKFSLTEEYGSATLIERMAFNDMTAKEFVLAFPYCLPEIGPWAVARLFGPQAMARFEWNAEQSFFDIGRARRMALAAEHKKLDPVVGSVIREEMREKWWRYVLVTLPLSWCGLWVGKLWSLVFIPLFAWACVAAVRRRPLFLLYALPALVMVALHAAVANHYSRYNLILIGPASAGAAWIIAGGLPLVFARKSRQRT
jgi:4-amino-4-deoxy-L-arabinose transferase-like glycosyltransferase